MEILQQMGSLPIFFIMCLVIYFFMIRPQSIQQKKHAEMLKNLKKNDKIVTRGGVLGTIVELKGKDNNILIIDTGNNTKITVKKSYISSLTN